MIYLLPFVAAAIGWFTNYIAVKMLFRPKKPIRILFFTVQGIFPKRQKALAEKLGTVVANELFSIEDLTLQLKQTDTQPLLSVVENKLDDFINHKLPTQMPMLTMFLNQDIKNKIKNTLLREVEQMIPEMIDQFSNQLTLKVDINSTVKEKVEAFSTEKLEAILFEIMKKEFKFIEILGAILGFLIGILQVILVSFE